MSDHPGVSDFKRAKYSSDYRKQTTEDDLECYLNQEESEDDGFRLNMGDVDSWDEYSDSEDVLDNPINIVECQLNCDTADNSQDTNFRNTMFTKANTLLVTVPNNQEPYDYFRLLLDDNFINRIVEETNSTAIEYFLAKIHPEHSQITEWKQLTQAEFLRFLGLVFHTGTIRMNRLQDYWKTHRLFKMQCFGDHMGRNRFLAILRYLNFVKTPNEKPTQEDPLYKIKSVINYFNETMKQVYYPNKNLCLDEPMALWKGRFVYRHFTNTPQTSGIKLYMLTEPCGIILNFAVYAGKSEELGGKGHIQKVVMQLMSDKLNNGHSLYLDNYYTSVQLAQALLDNKTLCTGTLRASKRNTPIDVEKGILNKGETICKYSPGIMVGKWRDKKDIMYISTEYDNAMEEVKTKRGLKSFKPRPLLYLNMNMGHDRQNQLMSYYPCISKSIFWYQKLAIYVFQMLLYNSFLLFNKYSMKKMPYYDFRLAVIEKLLPEPEDKKKETKPKMMKTAHHLPHKIEKLTKNSRTLRKKCRVCQERNIRKDTIYDCMLCPGNPGLCLDPCFEIYHKKN